MARFLADPREEHGDAMYLCMYIYKTCLLGFQFKPDPSKGFECYADTNFTGTYICALMLWILVLPNFIQVGIYFMPDAPSYGPPSYRC